MDEVFQQLASARGVDDFGVELEAVEAALDVGHGGDGAGEGAGDGGEAGGQGGDLIAVAHPDVEFAGEAGEERGVAGALDEGGAVLAAVAGFDVAAEELSGHLHAVADAEDGEAEVEKFGVAEGRVGFKDARGAAGEDDAGGFAGGEGGGGGVEAQQFAIDVLLADTAGDELAVLRAVVENGDPVVGLHEGEKLAGGAEGEQGLLVASFAGASRKRCAFGVNLGRRFRPTRALPGVGAYQEYSAASGARPLGANSPPQIDIPPYGRATKRTPRLPFGRMAARRGHA